MKEATTPLISIQSWGTKMRFGNLVKSDGLNALCWYTVELKGPQPAVYAFDALYLAERLYGRRTPFTFPSDLEDSIRQAQALAERAFPTAAEFETWVREHFYAL